MEGDTSENVVQSGAGPVVRGGRYDVGDLLGSGGMAEVYAARDRVLDRDVAIKFFRPLDGPADRARFASEARLLAGLSHPGLVTVYDANLDDDGPCLVMSLVDGGTLRGRIDTEGPLTSGQVATLGVRLAAALAHVHANGIVHRDIKPSNVLIDSAGDYFLADFGLAWTAGSARLTNSGEMVGTAYYLAPEQVTGVLVGPEADIYALGLVLLECLTGHTEYEGTDVEVAVARLSRAPAVPDGLGPAWRHLLTAMTNYHPAHRPDANDCARRLHAITQAVPGTDTGSRDVGQVGAGQLEGDQLPDTEEPEDVGASSMRRRTTQPIQPQPRTPVFSRRPRRLHAGLGAAGAAAVALTALMLPNPDTAGDPVPGGSPGQTTTTPTQRNAPTQRAVPTQRDVPTQSNDSAQGIQAPTRTAGAPSATTAPSPQRAANTTTANPAAPVKDDKPKHGNNGRAGHPTKTGKPQ
jgi:serine/threonine protein kinase